MKHEGHRCNEIQEQPLDFSVKRVGLFQSHYALSKPDENKSISVLELRWGDCAKDIPAYTIRDFEEQVFLSSSSTGVFCLTPV